MILQSLHLEESERVPCHLASIQHNHPHLVLSDGEQVVLRSVSAVDRDHSLFWFDQDTLLIAGIDAVFRYHVDERRLERLDVFAHLTIATFISQAPDGRIAYVTDNPIALIVRTESGKIKQTTKLDQPTCIDVDWMNGYAHIFGEHGIEAIDLDTGRRHESLLVEHSIENEIHHVRRSGRAVSFETHPIRGLSPDGRWLALVDNQTTLSIVSTAKSGEAFVVAARPSPFAVPPSKSWRPTFSPDSRLAAAVLVETEQDRPIGRSAGVVVVDMAAKRYAMAPAIGGGYALSPCLDDAIG